MSGCKAVNRDEYDSFEIYVDALEYLVDEQDKAITNGDSAVWDKAIRAAMAECTTTVKRQKESVGARTCFEIKDALFNLLRESK